MKVYFYHTQNIQYVLDKYRRGEFPAHFLYGATRLGEHGIEVVWHKSLTTGSRLRLMLYNTRRILFCRERFDVVYATHYRGIEPVIFLRALGLFRRRIVIWHHQPIVTPRSRFRELLGRLFYRGIDDMFFFSQKLIDDSLKSRKARPERMHLGHWGADLEMYDRIMRADGTSSRTGFISTGKEMRDMPTLVSAFNQTGAPLEIYLNRTNGNFNYEQLFRRLCTNDNIHVHFSSALIPYELAKTVNKAACVVICCEETKYTVGLTTVVEALALGLPVICSRNPQIPIDLEREGCGISIPYYNIDEWVAAVRYICSHPDQAREMGRRGRALAERLYNDCRCAEEVAQVLNQTRK